MKNTKQLVCFLKNYCTIRTLAIRSQTADNLISNRISFDFIAGYLLNLNFPTDTADSVSLESHHVCGGLIQ